MYGYDGNLSAEDWLGLELPPEALTKKDRARLVENGTLDETHIGDFTIDDIVALVQEGVLNPSRLNAFTDEDLDLGHDLPEPDYTTGVPEGALLIGD